MNLIDLMRDFAIWRSTQKLGYTTNKAVGALFDLFDEPRSLGASKGIIYDTDDGEKADRQRVVVKLWAAMAEWGIARIKRIA
jgi:hypothetical protein